MPVLELKLGKVSEEIKERLIGQLSHEASKITKIPQDAFITFIHELDSENIGMGEKTLKAVMAAK